MLTIITTHGRWRQEAKEFKVNISYKMILRSVWAKGAPILHTKTNKQTSQKDLDAGQGVLDNVIHVIRNYILLYERNPE